MVARKLRLSLDPAVSSKVMSAFPTCRIKETTGPVCVNQHKSQIYGTFRGQHTSELSLFSLWSCYAAALAHMIVSISWDNQLPMGGKQEWGLVVLPAESRSNAHSMKRIGVSLKLSKLRNHTVCFGRPLRKWLLKASKICVWGFFADPFPDHGWFCGDAWFFSEIYSILDLQISPVFPTENPTALDRLLFYAGVMCVGTGSDYRSSVCREHCYWAALVLCLLYVSLHLWSSEGPGSNTPQQRKPPGWHDAKANLPESI